MENTQQTDFLIKDETLVPYQDLVEMVNNFRDQLQSLDYRVTNKNFGSKFYQTKEHINSKAKLSAGSKDEIVVMDGQHPLYRFWVGAEDPLSAPFTIDKNGNAVVNSITLTGYIPTGGALTDIGVGNITGTYIDSGAITTPKLAATAIDGMTITGALIRTSSSGGRVQLNDSTDALEVYDISGVKRIVLDNDEMTFINSGAATRGGLIANTTELYVYALNGGNLHLEAEGSLYGVLIYAGGAQVGAFTTAGLGMDNHITMNGNDITGVDDITMNSSTSVLNVAGGRIDNPDEIRWTSNSTNPGADGRMKYYVNGGSEGLRMQFGGSDFQFDATAV